MTVRGVPSPNSGKTVGRSDGESGQTDPVLTEPVLTNPVLTNPVLTNPALTDPVLVEAVRSAQVAAAAAGVAIRDVDDFVDLAAITELFASIWGREQGPPVTPELLRAMSKAGSYLAGAFCDDRMVGACIGFHEEPALQTLHSHIAGVLPGPWHGTGFALKLHQRAWALDRGINEIVWTYDPLVARNAYFNIAKLGARPVEYLANFYGSMTDAINGSDESDRMLARWSLRDAEVVAACAGNVIIADSDTERRADAVDLVTATVEGEPVVCAAPPGKHIFLVATPSDIAELRSTDPVLAARWRIALRDTLEPLMHDGARIVGFDRRGVYILHRDAEASAAAHSNHPAPTGVDQRAPSLEERPCD